MRYSLRKSARLCRCRTSPGTFNVMELAARELAVDHLLMASTSSVYWCEHRHAVWRKSEMRHPADALRPRPRRGAGGGGGTPPGRRWRIPLCPPVEPADSRCSGSSPCYGPWGRPEHGAVQVHSAASSKAPRSIFTMTEEYVPRFHAMSPIWCAASGLAGGHTAGAARNARRYCRGRQPCRGPQPLPGVNIGKWREGALIGFHHRDRDRVRPRCGKELS